jgi:SAF domain
MSLALVISARDNVATALEELHTGQSIRAGDISVAVIEPVPRGHKVALGPIAAGEAVVKYGSPIGTASCDIAAGAHVHTHNLASTRGRGDLGGRPRASAGGAGNDPTAPRLAEPADDDRAGTARAEQSS